MAATPSDIYRLELDPATVVRLRRLMNAAPIMATYYTTAMNACVNVVTTHAKENAPVLTGTLRRGIVGMVRSPWEGVVGVGREVPYARRRELGFSGRTDSLGRYYPNDPGSFYLRRALEQSQSFIASTFKSATSASLREMSI